MTFSRLERISIGMEQICGTIERVLFTNAENGFTVAKIKMRQEKDLLSIVGTLPGVQPGETIICEGTWKHHPQHGRQFEVHTFSLDTPTDVGGIEKYLSSGLIKGVGPSFAKKIVGYFGNRTFEILDSDPDRLLEIPGIGEKKIQSIAECWHAQKSIRTLMLFLQSKQIRCSYAQKIYKVYGDESISKIQENPYELARSIFGIGFKTADELANHLGIAHDAPQRVEAGVQHLLWELSQEGHTCFPERDLIEHVCGFLEVAAELIEQAIHLLDERGEIVRNPIDEIPFVWVKPLYLSEVGIAREFARLQETPSLLRSIDHEKALPWVAEMMRIQPAKEQVSAIIACTSEKVHIITGGPGTGKSTITKAILRITEKLTEKILLAAPTGRAAKRMQEICRKKASTIHSLLEFDFKNGGFKRNKKHPLDCDLILIDEASMIDTQLMYNLLKAIPDHARVVFIGDIDQLPSVGAGSVLKDVIASERVSVTQLEQIFRQARGSKIVTNAHRINKGIFPDLDDVSGDFLFYEGKTPETILERVIPLIKSELPSKYSFNPIDDIQVLTPMKRGIVGTENLNLALQEALNPKPSSLERMGRRFRIGDKVMQIKNNYDKGIYNGDVGRIEYIDFEEQEVAVLFDGNEVIYDFVELDELMLAYAVSVHKYQGSECPCIVIPIHTSHFKLLFRNLLYTGITRGRKLVVLVGTKQAIAIATKNDNVQNRFTGLKTLLQTQLALADR